MSRSVKGVVVSQRQLYALHSIAAGGCGAHTSDFQLGGEVANENGHPVCRRATLNALRQKGLVRIDEKTGPHVPVSLTEAGKKWLEDAGFEGQS
jgi:hypothetical protein